MTKRCLTRWTTDLVVLLLVAAMAASALDAAEVRIDLVRDALIVVPVAVNDGAPVYFLLDTGADTTIVDTGLANKLGLTTLKQIRQATVTGSRMVDVSLVAKLAVGGAELRELPVLEQDLSGLRREDSRIVGIVGQNFLSRFNYLVDYGTRRLELEQGDEIRSAIKGEAVPAEVEEHRMIVAAEAESSGNVKLRLLLDSGANTLVLMGKAAGAFNRPTMQPKAAMLSMTGEASVRMLRVNVTVATHEFHDVPVSLMGDVLPPEIGDGLLPMALFDRVYVNNAQGYVVLNPRVKKGVETVARVAGE